MSGEKEYLKSGVREFYSSLVIFILSGFFFLDGASGYFIFGYILVFITISIRMSRYKCGSCGQHVFLHGSFYFPIMKRKCSRCNRIYGSKY